MGLGVLKQHSTFMARIRAVAVSRKFAVWHMRQQALLASHSPVLKPEIALSSPWPTRVTYNRICCFNIPFLLSTNPGLHSDRVKLGLGQTQCSHRSSIFRTLTQREGVKIISLPIPLQLGTPVDGCSFLWQLPWTLFRTHRTWCSRINQVAVFQGQYSILGNVHPTHSAVSTERSVARACTWVRTSAFWLPGQVSAPYEWGRGRQWGKLRPLKVNPDVFPHVSTSQGLIQWLLPLGFPLCNP